jgi:hypothetical protein
MTLLSMVIRKIKFLTLLSAGIMLTIIGCSTPSAIPQSERGSVELITIVDPSYNATHPAVLDQNTIFLIVTGLYRDDIVDESSRMSAGGDKPMRVFSDEDAEFLSPLLAHSLSTAEPTQLVKFRVSSSAGSGSEPTAGSLYVKNGSIHLTISTEALKTVLTPQFAAHTESAPTFASDGIAGLMSHVIDYPVLATELKPSPMPLVQEPMSKTDVESNVSPESPNELLQAKATIAKKNSEINMLRKESDWMKRALRDRDEEIKALKATLTASGKKKKASTQRTR